MKRFLAYTFSILILAILAGCVPSQQASTTTSVAPTVSVATVKSAMLDTTANSTPAVTTAAPTFTATANTAIPTATNTPMPSASPIAAIRTEVEWLAYIEQGRLTIQDLTSERSTQVEGEYRQILEWSPHQAYLLAVGKDGSSVVIDTAGKTQAEFKNLPQPALWARYTETNIAEDWLAVPRSDAALELTSFPSRKSKLLFEPGSLGADGMAFVRWGSNNSAIVTPSLAQMQNRVSFAKGFFADLLANGPDVQNLAVNGGGGPVAWDFHKEYFQVLDSVPGVDNILLGFLVKDQCSSCQVDGLKLVSLDSWSGRNLPLGVVLLNTPEAYAWNPAQPGLLALAEGGSRFTLENKRLALLNVPAGTPPQFLTGKDQAVFEPAWSPDGLRLAYATLPDREGASGSGQDLEAQMGGRAIAVYDLKTGANQTLTQPAQDEIDGWPRWSADGKAILYARKRLADSTTQVWKHHLATGEERLVVSISAALPFCHRNGCGWDQILAYAPGQSSVAAVTSASVLSPTPPPIIQTDTPRQGMITYHNTAYGFSLQYPATWDLGGVGNLPNYIKLTSEKGALIIGYRRATQQANIQRTGVGAGDFVRAGSIQFLGKTLLRDRLVYGEKTKEVFYQGDCEFSVGNRVFTLGLDNNGFRNYEDADIPLEVQKEADQILEILPTGQERPMKAVLRFHVFTVVFLSSMILSACQSTANITASAPTATSLVPFLTTSSAPSKTVSTSTAAVIPTAAHSLTPQATPSLTPAAFNLKSDAWLVAPVDNQLVAFNPDGSGAKVLITRPLDLVSTGQAIKASPPGSGAMVAYVTSHKGDPDFQDIALNILSLPDGKLVKTIPLYNEKTQPAPWDGKSRLPEQVFAFANSDNLAWSPGGRLLAFTAMLDGPDADIYLYDPQAGTLQRLTNEPGQPGALTWSPDGKWLIYQQVENFGTGAGWNVTATWSVDVQKHTSSQLFGVGMRVYHGWTPDGQLIVHPFDFGMSGSQRAEDGLLAVDPASGEKKMLLSSSSFPKGGFIQPDYIPGSNWVAVSVEYVAESFLFKIGDYWFGTKGSNQGEIFALPLDVGQPKSIDSGRGKWGGTARIACFPNLPECFANWGDRIEAFSSAGISRTYANETNLPLPSPDGAWLAFYDDASSPETKDFKLQLLTPDGKMIRQVSAPSNLGYSWRPDNQGLLFVTNSSQICELPVNVEMPVICQPGTSQIEMVNAVWVQP